MLLLISLVLLVVQSCTAWINVNKNLTNRVIHIESLRYRGLWVDCYNAPMNSFYGTKEQDVYYQPRTQYKFSRLAMQCRAWKFWNVVTLDLMLLDCVSQQIILTREKVVDCGDYVCLESLHRPSYYLYPTLTSIVGVWKEFYPQDKEWAHWIIECKKEDMKECRLFTRRLSNYAYSGYQYYIQTGSYADDTRSLFRILAPNPSDYYVTILETENYSSIDQKKTIQMSEGITDSISHSFKVSAETSFEIFASFKYFGGFGQSISNEWTTTTSKTFQQSTQISYDIVIPAKTKITFQQLTGRYGPFKIAAKKFKILSQKLI